MTFSTLPMVSLTIFLLFLFPSASSVSATDILTLPSGLKLSENAVRSALPPHLKSTRLLSLRLFHLHGDTLFGPDNFSLSLNHHSIASRTLRWHPSLSVTLDNNPVFDRPSNLRILSVPTHGYKILLSGVHSHPLRLWGNGINLFPLSKGSSVLVDVNHDDDVHVPSFPPPPSFCPSRGGDDDLSVIQRQSATSCTLENRHVIEIAAAFDTSFCNLAQNSKLAALGLLQSLFDEANIIFNYNTCVELALVSVEGHCTTTTDPYTSIFHNLSPDRGTYIPQIHQRFREFFSTQRSSVHRDVAYLFSAYNFDGRSFWGYAATPGTCSNKLSYGIVNGPSAKVFAHEVGHSLNAHHTDKGVMTEIGIPGEDRFASNSVANITFFVNNGNKDPGLTPTSSRCLSTGAPTCESSCPSGTCSHKTPSDGGSCIVPVKPSAGYVSCKLSEDTVRCVKLVDIDSGPEWHFYKQVECETSTPFVQVAYNASDPEIMCCPTSGAVTRDGVTFAMSSVGTFQIDSPSGANSYYDIIFPKGLGSPLTVTPQKFTFLPKISAVCSGGGDGSDSTSGPSPPAKITLPALPSSSPSRSQALLSPQPVSQSSSSVGCRRGAGFVRCIQLVDINYGSNWYFYKQVNCPTNKPFVQVPYNRTDPNVMCCSTTGAVTNDGVPYDKTYVTILRIRFRSGTRTYEDTIYPRATNIDPRTVKPHSYTFLSGTTTAC